MYEQTKCRQCGEPIDWRVSRKSGRKYMVNAAGATGPLGAFHSAHCPARKQQGPIDTLAPIDAKHVDPVVQEPVVSRPHTDLAAIIAKHVADLIPQAPATLDEERVRAIVRDMGAAGVANITVTVRGTDAPIVDVGRQHKQFPTLLAILARRRNVWLSGPAGGGKTTAAHVCSTALSLAFGSMSVGPQTPQSSIFGYMDAHGNYVSTEFRRRYEQGGVFLMDEIDRGNPGVLTALNQAIENGVCAFPDCMVAKHADFILIAGANTWGNGASREYVGPLQQDAALLDRFAMLAWDYDEALETAVATATYKAAGGTDDAVLTAWLTKVRTARGQAEALKVRHIVSPRASIVGADFLGSGMDEKTVAQIVLWKGLDADTVARLS